MIRKTLMVSLTCCLVLNLHIAAFADCPGTPPPPPSQTEIDAFVAFQGSLFNTLFASPWAQEDMAYLLSTRVDGLGVYQGTNQLGQPFTLSVVWDQPLDLATVCMTPQQHQQALADQVTIRTVAGTIITPLAQVDVIATAISGFQGPQLISYFMVVALADPNGPFFPAATNGGQTQAILGGISSEPFDGPVIQPCPDSNPDCGDSGVITGPPPCANCAQCNATHQNSINSANAAFQAAVSSAANTLQNTFAANLAGFAVVMAGCAVSFWFSWLTPGAAAICGIGAIAGLAIADALAQANFCNAVSSAKAAKDGAIAAADAAFAQCRSNFNCDARGCP